jgi:hypothetical protein
VFVEFGEGRREPMFRVGIQTEFVVASTYVLDKSVSGADHSGRTKLFEAAHRPQSSLEPTMICFDQVIAVLLGEMAGSGHQLVKHPRIGRCLVRRHRARMAAVIKSPGKEPTGGRQVPLLRHQDVDDLAVLVDRSVQVGLPPGNLHIRFVCTPPITGYMPARSSHVDQ